MADEVQVGVEYQQPTHDVSLSDGITSLGFLTVDRKGVLTPNLFRIADADRTPLQTTSGAPSLADILYPYMTIVQDEFGGGMKPGGMDEDTTRFADSNGVIALGSIIKPFRRLNVYGLSKVDKSISSASNWPGATDNYIWHNMISATGNTYKIGTYSFNGANLIPGTSAGRAINFIIRKIGNPVASSVVIRVYAYSGGIGSQLSSLTLTNIFNTQQANCRCFVFNPLSEITIFNQNIVVSLEITYSTVDGNNYYSILMLSGSNGFADTGTGWQTVTGYSPVFHLYSMNMRCWGAAYANTVNYLLVSDHNWNAALYQIYGSGYLHLVDLGNLNFNSCPRNKLVSIGDTVYIFRDSKGANAIRRYNNQNILLDNIETMADGGVIYNDPVLGKILWMAYKGNRHLWIFKDRILPEYSLRLSGIFPYYYSGVNWDEISPPNVTITAANGVVEFDIGSNFTTGLIGCFDIPEYVGRAVDIQTMNKITFLACSTIDLDKGDMKFVVDDSAQCTSPIFEIELPAMKANTVKKVVLNYDPKGLSGLNEVRSLGFRMAVDKGAMQFILASEICFTRDYEPIILTQNQSEYIHNMIVYGDPETLWVFTNRAIYYLNGDKFYKLPISEYENVAAEDSGRVVATGDVYLYFNIGVNLFRYYRNSIQYIGPNIGDFRGRVYDSILDILSMPGNLLYVLATYRTSVNDIFAALLQYDGNSWTELYNCQIDNTGSFYNGISKLYLRKSFSTSEDNVIAWFINGAIYGFNAPMRESLDRPDNYWYGLLITNHIDTRLNIIQKYYDSLRVGFANDQSISGTFTAYYKTNVQNKHLVNSGFASGGWSIIGSYTSNDEKDIAADSTHPNGGIGRNIAFAFEWYPSAANTQTAFLDYYTVQAYGVIEPKRVIAFSFLLGDAENETDKQGNILKDNITTKLSKILDWKNNPKPLTLRTNLASLDNLKVQIMSFDCLPLEVVEDEEVGRGREKLLCNLSLIEI